jgi:hypothetical protein
MANCPNCGAGVREGKAFCPECGEPLGAARAAEAGEEQPPEFRETVVVPPSAAAPTATPPPQRSATITPKPDSARGAQGAGDVGEPRPGFFGRGAWVVVAVVLALVVLAFLAVAFFAR